MNQPPVCGSAPKMRHITQSQVELMLLRCLTLNRAVMVFGALCGGGEGVILNLQKSGNFAFFCNHFYIFSYF